MCGISGIWDWNSNALQESTLTKFNNSMTHRGPDGSGVHIFSDQNLGLAHRRLSILDLSEAGKQPMTNKAGRFWITYNGEIFNFIEIRDELLNNGYSFSSDTDTEVIIAAFERWGVGAFHKFNGMWALAIWDKEKKELTLSRDRYGIKPLYFLETANRFAFASETNAFLHLEGFSREINENHFRIALDNPSQIVGAGHSLFKMIYQILPGHYATIKSGDRISQKRWYSIFDSVENVTDSYDAQVEKFRSIFEDSVKIRMRSDVPLATALSGGVDSTAVYSMVHHLMNNNSNYKRIPKDWQKAFVAVFPGTEKDEKEFAEKAIEFTKGEATYLEPKYGNLPEDVLRTTRAFDSISTTPLLSITNVYRGMRDGNITVSLDGHGVDEMLYGYKKMIYDGFEYYKWNSGRKEANALKEVLVGLYAEEERIAKRKRFDDDISAAFSKRNSLLSKLKGIIKRGEVNVDMGTIHETEELSDKPYDFSRFNPFEQSAYREFFQATLPTLLRNFDKASMQSHIEIRMPFMDYRLVEYAFSIPFMSKVGGGFTKRIVRDAMKGIMPEANRIRTYKVGLGAPTNNWFQDHMKEMVLDISHDQKFLNSDLWDGKTISQNIENRYAQDTWDLASAAEAWKYLNAHIISHV